MRRVERRSTRSSSKPMITHHQGALAMVAGSCTRTVADFKPAVDDFARDVEADQSIEIARMTDMLTAGGS